MAAFDLLIVFIWQTSTSEKLEKIWGWPIGYSIPPKVSISVYMNTLKGKTAIGVFKGYPMLKECPYWGNHFWSREYFVSMLGINEDMIRRNVKYQEGEECKEESNQQGFGFDL